MRPKLILHPGFAKCATTYLQSMFLRNDHALARKMGVVWLGEGFRPFGGLPPVMEIGYSPDQAIETIKGFVPEDQIYLLSAESLGGATDVQDALKEKFDVIRVAMTIRSPASIALSDYSFRNWTMVPVETLFTDARFSIQHSFRECTNHSKRIETKFGVPVQMCPIELPDLEHRFCTTLLEKTPVGLENFIRRTVNENRSGSLSLAAVLHEEITREGLEVTPAQRGPFVRLVQSNPGPDHFHDVIPEVVAESLSDGQRVEKLVRAYGALLKGRMDPHMISDVHDAARTNLRKIAAKPTLTADLRREIVAHAQILIAQFKTL